jgi:hypothetical protein
MGFADNDLDLAVNAAGGIGLKPPSHHVDDLPVPSLHASVGVGQLHEDSSMLQPRRRKEKEVGASQTSAGWQGRVIIV